MAYRWPIKAGDRVAIAAHTDSWMRGRRYGKVEDIMINEEGTRSFLVVYDEHHSEWLSGEDLLGAV
jgi:hypothetical protein